MTDHPPMERLEAPTLSEADHEHLQTCPRCRIDRRTLLSPPPALAGGAAALARAALSRAQQSIGADPLDSWRHSRSEAERSAPSVDGELPVGTMAGPYRLVALLGRGGMAVVYRAVHAQLETESPSARCCTSS